MRFRLSDSLGTAEAVANNDTQTGSENSISPGLFCFIW